jgi:SPW repeat-containing protein
MNDQVETHAINMIAVAAGVWFIISPAAFGLAPWDTTDWNNAIAGGLVVVLGLASMVQRRCAPPAIRWSLAVLGAWIAISPWVFGYSGDVDRVLNTLGVGIVLLVAVTRCVPQSGKT